jgi:hypothetical protein
MIGVILGILLLLLLIGLVVLQGMIEWGGFDIEKFLNKNAKSQPSVAAAPASRVPAKAPVKTVTVKKPASSKAVKTVKTTKTAKPAAKAAKGKGKK